MICGSGKYFRVLSVGMAAGLLASCSSRPGEVLSDDVMAALLADLYVGEAYTVLEGPMAASASIGDIDSAQRVLRQGTMQKHGVTEAQFDTTLRWYGHHLDRYDDVCEKVIERRKPAGRPGLRIPALQPEFRYGKGRPIYACRQPIGRTWLVSTYLAKTWVRADA